VFKEQTARQGRVLDHPAHTNNLDEDYDDLNAKEAEDAWIYSSL
jgi:hypothetical protein